MKHFDMAIQQYMGILKVIFCIGLVFIIKGVASIEDKKTQEEFIGQLFDPSSGILTEHTAEVLWLTCWEDLVHLKKENGDLDLCLAEEPTKRTNEISLEVGSIARENIQKLINGCYPQLKEKVLNCLRKNNLQFNVHKEENDFKTWHATNSESLSSRRYLGHVFPQHISEISIKAEDEDKKKSKSSKDEASGPPVAIIGVVALVGVALLFLCCFLLCGSGQDSQNDERPLLSMSMTDYSVGSASNNNLHNISMKEDKNRALSSNNILVDDNKISVEETESVEVASVGVRPSFELKPPPGRSIGDGLPPLKPPPGRPDLALPPPPGITDLPLPPPPGRPDLALPPPPGRPDLAPPPPPATEPPISNPSNTNAPPPPPPSPRSSSSPSPPTPPRPPNNAPPPPPPPGGRGPPPPPPPGGRGPPPPPGNGPRPPPPPPGKGGAGPRPPGPPPPRGAPKPPPFGSKRSKSQDDVLGGSEIEYSGPAKAKLKPFFWDKVQANNDQTMVWNQLKAGSFQFNEEMMETLFGYTAAPADKNKGPQKKEAAKEAAPQFIQIIDGKKAQNLSILLKALNVTMEEVCDALLEGNELPTEFLQTLLKMAPTQEEELKLRLFNGSLAQLGPADRFLKAVVDISFSYKRMEALLYMGTLHEELNSARDSFAVLEVACRTLRSSRLFLKLLEAVLKTGNRMNDGTFRGGAQAFKLDTLLKLSDVKGVDGKTTLLHFVVQEIMRTEGIRAARMEKESLSFSSIKTDDLLEDVNLESEDHYRELGLQAVSRLSTELENVKKAAAIDADGLVGTTLRLGHGIVKTKEFLKNDVSNMTDDKGFGETVKSFVENAEGDVKSLLEEEKKIMALVKSTGDYFHGDTGKDEGLRLFAIVRDFLIMLDKVCREIKANAQKKPAPAKSGKQETPNNQSKGSSSSESNPPPPSATPSATPDIRQRIAPAIANRRVDDFSSDEDSP